MSEFDPSKPAVLHDGLNDRMIAWTGEKAHEWADTTQQDGTVDWDGLMIDGWAEALGGEFSGLSWRKGV